MDMNRDILGLNKYLFIILMPVILSILLLYFCLNFRIYEYYPSLLVYDNKISSVIIFLFLILFVLYFIIPIVFTIIAIKQHWSSYLDKFFNQLKLPTIVFILDIAILFIFIKFTFVIGNEVNILWYLFFSGIFIPYCLIFPVILIHNLLRILKK